MTSPLLTTKLYLPPLRPDRVDRPRLIDRLEEGRRHGRRLTLLSAPAGFGKTTLVSSWLSSADLPACWLSLDEEDRTPARFWTYVIAALQTNFSTLGGDILQALQTPQPPPIESLLTALLNEIATLETAAVLVLDDYHTLDAPEVDRALTFFLDHLPPQLHLVMTTREDPQLPLARLRARGQLSELRAADLRFTPAEAADFFNRMMGFALSAAEIEALEQRTEGWIAGLQLAALSLQGREDTAGFIHAFAGDHRFVVDYLVEEVLARQPLPVRRFLLQTSILDRLSGPLCAAVTGQADSGGLLTTLEKGNLFLTPLDDRRGWYRYHHLFAGVLRTHLHLEQPEEVAELHRRAAAWCAANSLPEAAVRHALAAADFPLAAGLVEQTWPAMDRSRRAATWLGWVEALPEELVRARPVLGVGVAWALLDGGRLEAAAEQLERVEALLDRQPEPSGGIRWESEQEFKLLPASIASARAYLALAREDGPATVLQARRALALLPADDHHRRATPAALLGLASWAAGDCEEAHRSFAAAMASYERAGNLLFAITGTYVLAGIEGALGRLRAAEHHFQRSLRLAENGGELMVRGTADLHTGLAEISREQNDLAAADDHLRRSLELGENAGLPRWRYRWCLAHALVEAARGGFAEAEKYLDEGERVFVRGPVPDVRPVGALRARVWLMAGRPAAARRWAAAADLSAADEPSYLREYEHLTLARVLLVSGRQTAGGDQIEEVLGLLARLQAAAEAAGRQGSLLDILVVQALAYEAQGETDAALRPLAQALALAEPEGYVRLFLDEGEPMNRLLAAAEAQGIPYAARLRAGVMARPAAANQPLVEPLSERELEILQLVATGLSNREIAERLFLALSTVKGHNRSIYAKLQVRRRTEAIARARELGLL